MIAIIAIDLTSDDGEINPASDCLDFFCFIVFVCYEIHLFILHGC